MSHQRDVRDVYRQRAEACLAVLTKTTTPTSQAMLTAMAHTGWRSQFLAMPSNIGGTLMKRAGEASRPMTRSLAHG
jgi:hypothetical protein